MSAISTYLEYIRSKIYAKDVRTAIVNAISQCYDDVNKPALQTEAMRAAVQAKIDAGEMAALTIADGSLTGAKLANGTIPTAKIADGAVTAVKLSDDVKSAIDGAVEASADVESITKTLSALNLCVDKDTVVGYIGPSGGIVKGSNGERTTDYIPVNEGDVINIQNWGDSGTGAMWFAVGRYDSEKTFISRAVTNNSQTGATYYKYVYTVPSGVSYVRISARYYGHMMVTKSSFDMAYLPASDDIATIKDVPDAETIISENPTLLALAKATGALEGLNLCVYQNTASGYLTASGTISAAGSGERTTDYIPVTAGETINIRNWSNPGEDKKLWFGIGLYDAEKTWIKRASSNDSAAGATFHQMKYTVPDGTSFIRVSARFYGTLMITRGEFDLGYLPASDDIATKQDLSDIDLDVFKREVSDVISTEWLTDSYESGWIATQATTIDITNVKADSAYKHIVVACAPNDIFQIYGRGYDVYHGLWVFIKADGTAIKSERTVTYTEYKSIIAPANAAYLVSNVVASESYSLVKGELIGNKVAALSNALGASTGLFNPLLRPAGPKFALHRGVCTQAPENTIPAFELAGQGGSWAIETDVYETTDGYFILSHDNDVSRMTDGTGKITEMTYAQTQECTIDHGANVDQYPNLKMPTLQEYLSICRRYGCVAFIEIKGVTHYDVLVQAIRAEGMEGTSTFLMYYNANTVTTIRNLTAMPILLIGSAGYDIDTMITQASAHSDIWLTQYSETITAEHVQKAHTANIPIGPWAIDAESSADRMVRYGCDYITSNSITKFTT